MELSNETQAGPGLQGNIVDSGSDTEDEDLPPVTPYSLAAMTISILYSAEDVNCALERQLAKAYQVLIANLEPTQCDDVNAVVTHGGKKLWMLLDGIAASIPSPSNYRYLFTYNIVIRAARANLRSMRPPAATPTLGQQDDFASDVDDEDTDYDDDDIPEVPDYSLADMAIGLLQHVINESDCVQKRQLAKAYQVVIANLNLAQFDDITVVVVHGGKKLWLLLEAGASTTRVERLSYCAMSQFRYIADTVGTHLQAFRLAPAVLVPAV
jgi:hypothetical protein